MSNPHNLMINIPHCTQATYIAADVVHCFVGTREEPDINTDKSNNRASNDKVVEVRAGQLHHPVGKRNNSCFFNPFLSACLYFSFLYTRTLLCF